MLVRTSDMIAAIPMVPIYGVWRGMLVDRGVDTSVGGGSEGGHHSRFRNTTLWIEKDGEKEVLGMCCGEIAIKLRCESGC